MSDVEHLFMCLGYLDVFFGEMSIHVVCPFLIGLFLLGVSCMGYLDILDTNPVSDVSFANIFSRSVGCLLVLLIVSFAVPKLFISM